MKFKIIYVDLDDFDSCLQKAEKKLIAKVIKTLEQIENEGIEFSDVKLIEDSLYEISVRHSSNIFRVLFFYEPKIKQCLVVTSGFVKKTRKTPVSEIVKAKRKRDEYLRNL